MRVTVWSRTSAPTVCRRHRVDQPTGRRVAARITPFRCGGSHQPRRPQWQPGQRMTGEDGTLTWIVEPGCAASRPTSFALVAPSPEPPQTTVLVASLTLSLKL